MEERLVDIDFMFVANDQSPEVSDPGDAPFHLPAAFVSPQLASILRRRFAAIGFVRTDQVNASFFQPLSQRIGVGGLVIDQSGGVLAGPAASPRDRHTLQRRFDQCRFVRGRRGKLNSQRNTLAACHHHPLRTLSAFGFSDALAPFFAGAKEPSAKVSSQFKRPSSSNLPRNLRQIVSQTSCSSQSRSRRQQVLGDGYCAGRSFHRAPDLSTHKIPSKHRRSSTRRRPPAADGLILGNNGSILFHCSSVSSELCRDMKRIPFHGTFNHKRLNRANLYSTGF
jgi:hypothetical protein